MRWSHEWSAMIESGRMQEQARRENLARDLQFKEGEIDPMTMRRIAYIPTVWVAPEDQERLSNR